MIELSSKQNCTGCSACANICPRGCIKMTADEEGFLYPKVNEEMCMDCGLCENVCPMLHKPQQLRLKARLMQCEHGAAEALRPHAAAEPPTPAEKGGGRRRDVRK